MGLMSDLKEFGQNFVLAAGAGIAKNIEERAKEDRAAILASTKELKARIAKNKAAQTKIDREVEGQLRTLNSLAPGLPVEVKKTALQSKELFDIYVDAIKNDKDKSGYWISDFAREKGFDPKDIYKGSGTKISQVRSPLAPAKPKKTEETVSVDNDTVLRTLLGAGMGPDEILKQAEDNISGSGRGTLSEGDLKYANLVASRRIAPGSAPVTIRGKQKPLSDVKMKAFPPVKKKFLTALAPKGVKDAKQWGFRNQEFVTQAIQNVATMSPVDYNRYVKDVVKSRNLDAQQENTLKSLLPLYYASAIRTFNQERQEELRDIFPRDLPKLPYQTD
tara:strand:- start:26 stop:1024 length:999 start_codon:yes stop_codon:yes gene_type:complete